MALPLEQLKIKAATRKLVKLAGGLDAAADQCRVKKSQLDRYGSPHEPEHFIAADVIADLESDVGQPIVTTALAEAQGYTLRATDGLAAGGAVDPLRMGAELTRELGEFQVAALDAGAHVDARELDQLIKEAEDLKIAASKVHDQLCRQRAARTGSARLAAVRAAE